MVTTKDLPLYFDNSEDSSVYVFLPKGAIVSVIEDCNEKFYLSYNNCTGYADADSVELLKRNAEFICYGVVDTEELSVYASCENIDNFTEPAATLSGGKRIEVIGFSQGWFSIKSGDIEGFVSGDSLDLTLEKEAPKPKRKPPALPEDLKKVQSQWPLIYSEVDDLMLKGTLRNTNIQFKEDNALYLICENVVAANLLQRNVEKIQELLEKATEKSFDIRFEVQKEYDEWYERQYGKQEEVDTEEADAEFASLLGQYFPEADIE